MLERDWERMQLNDSKSKTILLSRLKYWTYGILSTHHNNIKQASQITLFLNTQHKMCKKKKTKKKKKKKNKKTGRQRKHIITMQPRRHYFRTDEQQNVICLSQYSLHTPSYFKLLQYIHTGRIQVNWMYLNWNKIKCIYYTFLHIHTRAHAPRTHINQEGTT